MPIQNRYFGVSRQGVPLPQPSPTGQPEDDRPRDQAQINAFDLTPSYSVSDVAVPVEGGELTLEFRRTATVTCQNEDLLPPCSNENVLGPGWVTSLGSRITVVTPGSLVLPGSSPVHLETFATLVDEAGNTFQFSSFGGPWVPFTQLNLNSDTLRDQLTGAVGGTTLTVRRTYGTELTYTLIPTPYSCVGSLYYYRLSQVQDRNGNTLVYQYASNSSLSPSSIYVKAHPTQAITFAYNSSGQVTQITDPLGRNITYRYTGDKLTQILYPQVANPAGGMTNPTVNYTYLDNGIIQPVYMDNQVLGCAPPLTNRWVAPATITDANGNTTTFNYVLESQMPFGFAPNVNGSPGYLEMDRYRVQSVTTADGTAYFNTVSRSGTAVTTEITDTRGNTTTYAFTGSIVSAPNLYGKAVAYTTLVLSYNNVNLSAQYNYSADTYGNLTQVKDLSGNVVQYTYGSGNSPNQIFDEPASRTVDPGGLNIVTSYQYDPTYNKLTQMTDGEGKVTQYTLDSYGNRTQMVEAYGTAVARTTQYSYDSAGFMNQILDPDNRRTAMSKNSFGDLAYVTVTGFGDVYLSTQYSKDAMGRILWMTDPNNNVTIYAYDSLDRKTNENHAAVENVTGDLIASSTQYSYDLNGNPIEIVDDNGVATIKTYDDMNRLTSTRIRMTNASQNSANDIVNSIAYDAVGNVATQIDANGNHTVFTYDQILRLTMKKYPQVTLPGGSTTTYSETYGYSGGNFGSGAFTLSGWLPTSVTDKRGYVTENTYDNAYRLTQTVQLGNGSGQPTVQYVYNKVNQKISQTKVNQTSGGSSANETTYYYYDELHRLTAQVVDMTGTGSGLTPGAYVDNSANQTFNSGALTTTMAYDNAGDEVSLTDAAGNTTAKTYDGNRRLTSIIPPAVQVWAPAWGLNLVYPLTISFGYDSNGNKTSITGPPPFYIQTTMSYDARNRLTETIEGYDPYIVATYDVYDLMGHVIETQDPNGNVTQIGYDNAYRPTSHIAPSVWDQQNNDYANPTTLTRYDQNGNVLTVTDPRGVVTATTYDELNRARYVTHATGLPEAVTTETQYDPNNNVAAVVLSNVVYNVSQPQTTTYTYDPFNRKTSETLPSIGDGKTRQTTWAYDRIGNVLTVQDPKGQITQKQYDLDSRLTTASFTLPGGTVQETQTFTYNGVGKILTATDLNGTTTYGYDAMYRLLTEMHATFNPPAAYTVQNLYDFDGNLSETVYPGGTGRIVTYQYDVLDRMTFVGDTGDGSYTGTGYSYDNNGNILSCTLPNNEAITNTYDALNRVVSITATNIGTSDQNHKAPYTAYYGYDQVGNRVLDFEYMHDQGSRTGNFAYDGQYRLTSQMESKGNTTVTDGYTYDVAGNRLTETIQPAGITATYTYDNLNELTSLNNGNSFSYLYDLNGNRTNVTETGSLLSNAGTYGWGTSTNSYIYDAHNRLTNCTLFVQTTPCVLHSGKNCQTNTTVSQFYASYDYRTRRLSKNEGTPICFTYSGGDCIQEWSGEAVNQFTVNAEYVRGRSQGGGIGGILYSDRTMSFWFPGPRETFAYDATGNLMAQSDPKGEVDYSSYYDAFGNITSTTGSTDDNRFAHTKERDFSTGLDNHGMRYYDPTIGRYLTRDPLGYQDGLNAYLYVHDNPVNHIDPLGLEDEVQMQLRLQAAAEAAEREGDPGLTSRFAQDFRTPEPLSPAMTFLSDKRVQQQIGTALMMLPGVPEGLSLQTLMMPDAPRDTKGMAVAILAVSVVGHLGELPGGQFGTEATEASATSEQLTPQASKDLPEATTAAGSATAQKTQSATGTSGRGGPYGHLEDSTTVGPYKDFTQTQKKNILSENEARNNGVILDDRTGEVLVRPEQSQKGVTPPPNEAQIDHVYPKSQGGPNSYANAEVRSRANNIDKSDSVE